MIEDKFPEHFKVGAYHPSAFVYAWKKSHLEKLFDEILASNLVIKLVDVWLVEEKQVFLIIPLKSGDLKNYSWKIEEQPKEQWYDFAERSVKESAEAISQWDLEKLVRMDLKNRIWYHFEFLEE